MLLIEKLECHIFLTKNIYDAYFNLYDREHYLALLLKIAFF